MFTSPPEEGPGPVPVGCLKMQKVLGIDAMSILDQFLNKEDSSLIGAFHAQVNIQAQRRAEPLDEVGLDGPGNDPRRS